MLEAVEVVRSRTALQPRVGVVLGSGLGRFAAAIDDAVRIPYSDLPGLPRATAIGHKGELVLGEIEGVAVAVMSGRFHLYEGYSPQEVTAGIRLLKALGITTLVMTNAAGGIHPSFPPGCLVLITDHINLQGTNPLVGPNDDSRGPRFPDMTEAYSIRLRGLTKEASRETGVVLHEGVYAAVLGPSYETPAEIRFLRTIGADLVGMSTVPEVIAANHAGMEVLGISCVTNIAAGLSGQKLEHEEVLAVGQRATAELVRLLRTLIPRL